LATAWAVGVSLAFYAYDDPKRLAPLIVASIAGNVSADCVALVATPTRTDDFDPLVIQLSQHLKTVAILPQIAGLATIDNEHLNKPSAERWSGAVLSQLAPMVQNCIGAS
jgi:hypothetical protein